MTIPARNKPHRSASRLRLRRTRSRWSIGLSSVNGHGVSGVNPTTINTLARSPGCKSRTQTRTICTATASGSPGDDVFGVTTYAGTNATGAVLSFGTRQAKISGNNSGVAISNQLSLTLDGVIASLKLSLSPKRRQARQTDESRASR